MTPNVRSSHLSTKSFSKGGLVDSRSIGHTNPSIDDDDEVYSYNDLKSTRQDVGSFVGNGDDWSLESGVGPKEEPKPADVSTLAESDIYTTHEKEEEDAPKVDESKSNAAESVFSKGDGADRVPVNISFSTEETVDTDEEDSFREFDVDDFRKGPVSLDEFIDTDDEEEEEVDLDALADTQLEPQIRMVEPIENKELIVIEDESQPIVGEGDGADVPVDVPVDVPAVSDAVLDSVEKVDQAEVEKEDIPVVESEDEEDDEVSV